jgi:hypothetical protein
MAKYLGNSDLGNDKCTCLSRIQHVFPPKPDKEPTLTGPCLCWLFDDAITSEPYFARTNLCSHRSEVYRTESRRDTTQVVFTYTPTRATAKTSSVHQQVGLPLPIMLRARSFPCEYAALFGLQVSLARHRWSDESGLTCLVYHAQHNARFAIWRSERRWP